METSCVFDTIALSTIWFVIIANPDNRFLHCIGSGFFSYYVFKYFII